MADLTYHRLRWALCLSPAVGLSPGIDPAPYAVSSATAPQVRWMWCYEAMETVLAGAVAVVGTLLGSIVTYWLQRRASDHGEKRLRSSQLRQERIEAYGAFAVGATTYQQARATRWYRGQDDPHGPTYHEARAASDQAQGAALHALFRAQIVAGDNDVTACAQEALDAINEIRPSLPRPEFHAKLENSRLLLAQFVAHASRDVMDREASPALRELPEYPDEARA
ncbi:hypothetical protein ACIBKY_03960 [Nonomuraea sp. NPDC050394]|uniref:hypothetical protein n=1 Tax=Nonomuraea sp. NPDC050394 TaxID=3364363 RepID=UPI0037B83C1B